MRKGLRFCPNSSLQVERIRIENGGYAVYLKKAAQASLSALSIAGVTWISYDAGSGYFLYGENDLSLENASLSRNSGSMRDAAGGSSIDKMVESNWDESCGPVVVRKRAYGNTFSMHGKSTLSLPRDSSDNAITKPRSVGLK